MSAVKGSGGKSTPFSQVKGSDYNSTEVKIQKHSVLNIFYKLKVTADKTRFKPYLNNLKPGLNQVSTRPKLDLIQS